MFKHIIIYLPSEKCIEIGEECEPGVDCCVEPSRCIFAGFAGFDHKCLVRKEIGEDCEPGVDRCAWPSKCTNVGAYEHKCLVPTSPGMFQPNY